MQFRKLIQNINLLNILLVSTISLFAVYSLFPLLSLKIQYALPLPQKSTVSTEEETVSPQTPSLTEYAIVSEQNLFHPERIIPVEKKAEQPLPKPDFVLFGTLITDDLSMAYLEDLKAPHSTAGRGKRQVALRKGDSLSGFTLKEIETDKIVMTRGEEKITVSINDPEHPRQRGTAAVTTAAPASPQKPAQQMPAAVSTTQQRPDIQTRRAQQAKQRQNLQGQSPSSARSTHKPWTSGGTGKPD